MLTLIGPVQQVQFQLKIVIIAWGPKGPKFGPYNNLKEFTTGELACKEQSDYEPFDPIFFPFEDHDKFSEWE